MLKRHPSLLLALLLVAVLFASLGADLHNAFVGFSDGP
jgi:hypothetical protein